jgi:hypothetical protein
MTTQRICPVCESALNEPQIAVAGDWEPFDCPNCGRFRLSGQALAQRPPRWQVTPRARAVLSHAIRKMQKPGEWPLLTTDVIAAILDADVLPWPSEQLDLLIELVGTRGGPGDRTAVMVYDDRARLGAATGEGVMWVILALQDAGLGKLEGQLGPRQEVVLTLEGWKRFQELRAGRSSSRRAFMAMKYGDPELEALYLGTLVPAVERTGFKLSRLDANPPAGLIDVRLRAEIRRARFLIADLTHGNAGAYWEAGFAEGLGKPVIYMCKEAVFRANPTHFDTNHSHHVLWHPDRCEDCGRELSASIRATLPGEARMED